MEKDYEDTRCTTPTDLDLNNNTNNSLTNSISTQEDKILEKDVVKTTRSCPLVSRTNSNLSTSSFSSNEEENSTYALEDLEIIKTIGAGSFGRVVLVQDLNTEEYGAMKILSLFDLIQMKQVNHVKHEKNILRKIEHPFIISLKWHHKDEWNIYMLFDYICGGELFSYLRASGHFRPTTCKFYAAEVICALNYLHSKSIVYRDLKPENILLDREGHIKLTDFGFAKEIKDRTWTICGTPPYIAPEALEQKGLTHAGDYWALGVLIYEMLCGYTPFMDDEYMNKYEKILNGMVEWPRAPKIDPVAKDLVMGLLMVDPNDRLGNKENGVLDIQRHSWFSSFDWDDVNSGRLRPPFIPKVSFDGDTNNFDVEEYPETWKMRRVSEPEQELFSDF